MPPGQPVHRCFQCGFLRPCKSFDGDLLCVECAPLERKPIVADGGQVSDLYWDDTEHTLSREFKERREYRVAIVDGELEMQFDNSQYHRGEPLQTIKCSCGERFVKEKLAIEHIRSFGADIERLEAQR